jgi:parallel beta helix pectate lyase-like protein
MNRSATVKTIILACAVTILVIGTSRVYARQIGPAANLCAEMNRLSPGDELVLLPGRYRGPCTITKGGVSERPIVIRSSELERPAVLVYTGRTANVLDIKADHVVIRGLAFESVHPEADGIRIYARNDVTVEDCQFLKLGGIAVVANHYSARGIIVRRNTIKQSGSTAMYFGCHDGRACVIEDLLIERNYIHGVDAPDPMIGYGIQVKLNSAAVIRDNIVVDTKGPGIMIYGSHDLSKVSRLERNYVAGSRKSSGIVLGGGPVVVQNNITLKNARAGIEIEDYGQRDLTRAIAITHNTAVDNERAAIAVPEKGRVQAVVINNAATGRGDEKLFPAARDGMEIRSNVDCTQLGCFTDPGANNYSPRADSPLRREIKTDGGRFIPAKDFFELERGSFPTIGAIQQPTGPVVFGIKPIH